MLSAGGKSSPSPKQGIKYANVAINCGYSLMFVHSFHLLPYFVYVSSDGSDLRPDFFLFYGIFFRFRVGVGLGRNASPFQTMQSSANKIKIK